MCQFDICACAPVQSGREGPRVSLVVDRRVRPAAIRPGGLRAIDALLIEPHEDYVELLEDEPVGV